MNIAPLKLTALCDKSSFRLGSSILVQVKLSNASAHPIWINKRMGVGYEDSMVREIFFTVYDASTGRVIPAPEDERVDAHRLPPSRGDFQQLGPGDAADVVVDLSYWYRFKLAGNYQIIFTYDNHYDGGEFGVKAFKGKVTSNPVDVTLD